MKNVVCKNLEEKYHARLAKFFRDKELDRNVGRASYACMRVCVYACMRVCVCVCDKELDRNVGRAS